VSEQLPDTLAQAEAAEKALTQPCWHAFRRATLARRAVGPRRRGPNPRYPYSPHTMGWAVGCASAWLTVVTEASWVTTISLL
jgi:hypothetical protein